MFFDQSDFGIRFEWGLPGVRLVGESADVLIIVDALSFSTCVDVAVSRGAMVFPCRWKDERAAEYAGRLGAELAAPRGQEGKFSLSPASLMHIVRGAKIVLPSPNGSELSIEAASHAPTVISGCFRNARAVAEFARSRGKSIAVIACGERWPDGTLRPAVEDLAAAGAIIAELRGSASSESLAALAAWNSAKNDLGSFLADCASGRELIERGFAIDVEIAAEVDMSDTVPIFQEGGFAATEELIAGAGARKDNLHDTQNSGRELTWKK
jgi:2-phosphosulfolactate phosphatase